MSRPPSCTTHQMSMLPFIRSRLLGNQSIPLGTNTASSIDDATRMASEKVKRERNVNRSVYIYVRGEGDEGKGMMGGE